MGRVPSVAAVQHPPTAPSVPQAKSSLVVRVCHAHLEQSLVLLLALRVRRVRHRVQREAMNQRHVPSRRIEYAPRVMEVVQRAPQVERRAARRVPQVRNWLLAHRAHVVHVRLENIVRAPVLHVRHAQQRVHREPTNRRRVRQQRIEFAQRVTRRVPRALAVGRQGVFRVQQERS